MTEQPRKHATIMPPDSMTILAARHLDATEGPVQVGSIVDTSTRSAIDRVVAYVTKAHNSIAAPGTPPSGPAGASSANTGHVERLEIANRELKTASIEAIERAEQAEAARDRYARRADDRAEQRLRLTADCDRLRTRLAEQEAETMRQHEHAQRAEAERDQARQDAANAYGQRDRLRLRIAALADRWQMPGHISMPDAAAEIAEALDREKWAPEPDPITRARDLADRWDNALAVDKPYARALRAALDDPKPTTPADEQYKFATTWAEYNAGRRAALAGQSSTNRAAPVEARDPCPHCDQPYPRRLMETHLAVEHPDVLGRLAASGVHTPGCDCGHDGMGISWHGDDCPWRRSILDGGAPAAACCTATLVEEDATFRCVRDAGHYDESSAPSQAFGGGAVDRGGWHEAECGDGVFQLWADFAEGATSHGAPDAVPSCSPGVPETEAATCGDCNHPADWHDRYEGCVGPNGIGGLGSGDCTCTRGNPFDFSDTGPVPEEPPQPAVAEIARAIRLTREYVGADLLPAVEGWAWYDALRKWAPHELPEPESDSSTSPELGDPGFKETAETLNTGLAAPDAEPDTVTDPAWLSAQYVKALDEAFSTFNPDETEDAYLATHIANTVMRVRDRHVAQLRQRLELAEHFHQDIATVQERADVQRAETERLRARLGKALACVKLLKIYANQLDHGRQVGGSDVACRIRHILTGLDDRPVAEPRPA